MNCPNPNEKKLIIRLMLSFSQLPEHKFKHNFQNALNSIYNYEDNVETSIHYLLHFPKYFNERVTLLKNIQSVEEYIVDRNEFQI